MKACKRIKKTEGSIDRMERGYIGGVKMCSDADYVVLFKALADETRLKIVKMLVEEGKCPCHLLKEFNITQPTLSYHTKILSEAGIIEATKKGTLVECKVNAEKIKQLQELFNGLSEQGKMMNCKTDRMRR